MRHVAIAGAGIGGLTTALALARRGLSVEVFEQADAPRDIGAGIQQSPNAMAVHASLGVAEQINTRAFEPSSAILMEGRTGRVRLASDLSCHRTRYSHPYLHIHRADLHHVLRVAALDAKVVIHDGCQVTGYRNRGQSVDLLTDAGPISAEALIGADGIKSVIASQMHPKRSPQYTGYAAWRAVIPASRLSRECLPPAANLWMGDGRHLVAYYLRVGDLINIVGVTASDEWVDESWMQPGNPDELRAAFSDFEPRVQSLLAAVDECHYWGLFDHAPLAHWTDERVALLGDAAHPMLPFMAQGAAMAVEDGWVLASELAKDVPVAQALLAYESQRKWRTSRLQSISRANADLYHAPPGAGRIWRNAKLAVASALPGLAQSRLGDIFAHDVTR